VHEGPVDPTAQLVVTATDITRGRGLRLPRGYRDAHGLALPKQSVAEAVRMSDGRITRTFVSVSGILTASIGARRQSHRAQRVPRVDGVSFHDPFHGGDS
jgi:hypothetical protein